MRVTPRASGSTASVERATTADEVERAMKAGRVASLIGVYTVIDSKGSRSTVGGAYAMAIFVTGGIGTTIQGLYRRKWVAMKDSVSPMWRQYFLTGLASLITYWMVLLAVRRAPVGYVTALRESSVVFATFIGWKVLKEDRANMYMSTIYRSLGFLVVAFGILYFSIYKRKRF